ncbi:hypothetical protein Cgig2_028218 [Carnegiea gigantea]|uniref:Uncharacterized protein n=1 Tax=Carnegiea gigantea TaxID=171969 RepID=A0A9Q1GY64_9CARY|nr:hypothetical protein Cgig2_028218 [Carnegiea gigantea]
MSLQPLFGEFGGENQGFGARNSGQNTRNRACWCSICNLLKSSDHHLESTSFLTSRGKNPNSNVRSRPRLKQAILSTSSDLGTRFGGSFTLQMPIYLADQTLLCCHFRAFPPNPTQQALAQHLIASEDNCYALNKHGVVCGNFCSLSGDVISSPEDEIASNENENDREFVEDDPEDEGTCNQSVEDEEGNEEQDI